MITLCVLAAARGVCRTNVFRDDKPRRIGVCLMIRVSQIHASIPWITDDGIYLDTLLALHTHRSICIIHPSSTARNKPVIPILPITLRIILIRPAAGPDTDRGDLDKLHTIIHHIIPATNHANRLTCTACAIHKHKGIATKNTETHAIVSFLRFIFWIPYILKQDFKYIFQL